MTYYDRLKEFYSASERLNLKASEQLIMLHLLHINNCVGNPDSFYCTNERLATLSHLTVKAVKEAKCTLKNHGLIDFESDPKKPRKPTRYILPTTLNGTLNGTLNSTLNGTLNGTLNNVVEFNAREDKTKTRPDKKEEEEERAYVVSPQVLQKWEEYSGEKANLGTRRELHELEGFHGMDAVAKAIRGVHNTFNKVNIELVRGRLWRKDTKGEVKNVRNNGVAGGTEEWEHNANWFDD